MNNTIPNVPRELTIERDVFGAMHIKLGDFYFIQIQYQHPYTDNASTKTLAERIAALLSAPSPAGVDGLEVVGWYRMDDRKAITPYPSVCATWHKMGVKVGAAYSDSAKAIIDGLRGEVEEWALRSQYNADTAQDVASERDQQAQRIGELEGLLDRVKVSLSLDDTEWGYSAPEKYKLLADIRAALSAGKEGA